MNERIIRENAELLGQLVEPLERAARVLGTCSWAIQQGLRGQPQDMATAETESPTTPDFLCHAEGPMTPETPESSQSVRAALNAGQNSVSLVGVCPYCEHELLIPVQVAVGETT